MLSDPNNRPFPLPPTPAPVQPISIHDLVSMRIALDAIKEPSSDTKSSIAHLDKIIHTFTASLKG